MHEGGGGGEYGDGDADEEGDDLFSMSIGMVTSLFSCVVACRH